MKRFPLLMVVAIMMVLTGCASVANEETSVVTRQFIGAGGSDDPILQQVYELERSNVLTNVRVAESFPVQITATGPESVLTCLSNPYGRWIEDRQECEDMDEQSCKELGGLFDSCASACRNRPGAGMCIQVCVPVCSFAK